MKLHPKYIQIAGDALIPLLGFFLWDWSLYFIVLFYLLDLLTREILLHVKSGRIRKGKKTKNNLLSWVKMGTLSFLGLLSSIVLIHLTMPNIAQDFNPILEIDAFWNYEEMGIKQGYLLVPLIAFMGFQQYKTEFIVPKLYESLSIEALWKGHFNSMFVLLGFIGFSFGLVQFLVLPEWIFVIGIVLCSGFYQLFYHRV
jgi:hypothetical protein